MENKDFGLLTVQGSHEGELDADRADVHITVRGMAFFSGDKATTTVKEVEELAAELKRLGVAAEEDIHVHSITLDVNARVVGKSSEAVCHMRVRCTNLGRLPAIIMTVSGLKHASVDTVEWGYTFPTELQAEWLAQALRQATAKAQRSVEELGVKIVGVYQVREGWSEMPRRDDRNRGPDAYPVMARVRAATYIPAIEMGQTKRVTVNAEIVYRLVG